MDQRSKAELLRQLHQGPRILVLANVADAITARIVESEGFPAVASSSAGVAAVLGYADGERIPRSEMLFMVSKIANAVSIPVTADLEAGYGDPGGTVRALIAAGAVGLNFEDRVGNIMTPLATQLDRIKEIRAAADSAGVPIVLNARTDIYLARDGEESTRFERSVERLNAYWEAGADSLFAPGVYDAPTIGRLVKAVKGPLNILAMPGTPAVPELENMGVRRVSVGSGTSRVALGAFRRFVRQLGEDGAFSALASEALSSTEVQRLLSRADAAF